MHEKIVLSSGLRILYENVPFVQSASIGLWIKSGSRHEDAAYSGYSHFIEHMLFKGTQDLTAEQIAMQMDRIGGQVNAFTTKECTCFYARVMKDHLPRAINLLADMLTGSKFDEQDVVIEKGVILEEIDMYGDSPDDLVTERLFKSIYKGSALSRPVLGKQSVLEAATGAGLLDYMRDKYTGENIVVALSGSFDQSHVELIKERFSAFGKGDQNKIKPAVYQPAFIVKRKPIEQNHLCLALPAMSMTDPSRYALMLLSSIFGGGMSSRLFQTVREREGLCYSIYSFLTMHQETGILGIYTALSGQTEQRALELICGQMRNIAKQGVTADELEIAREQVKASVYMSLESTVSRSNSLGKGELFYDRVIPVEETIAAYDALTVEDIRELARTLFDFDKLSFSAVGRVLKAEDYKAIIMQ